MKAERERERVKVSRQAIIKNDYNFLGFILRTFDEENGTAIGDLFYYCLSRNEHRKKHGYFLRVDHKNWKTRIDNLTTITDNTYHEQGQEYLYLWSKDGKNETTDRLKNYLDHNNEKHLRFYQGAIIKHLMRPDFLKWKIDLFNDIYTQPHAREEKQEQKLDYDNSETQN